MGRTGAGALCALEVSLLGTVEVRRGGELVDLGGPQQRAVVAHLALEVGRVVPVERLIRRLWGDEPPGTPLGTLQSYVSRLRRVLEPGRRAGAPATLIASEAPGYVLRLPPECVDVTRFSSLAAAGREAAAGHHHEAALDRFDAALATWRGPALAGIGPAQEVGPLVLRLDEERWSIEEARVESLLALGRHVEAVGPLQAAVAEHPLREQRWAHLALALYRSRRQAEALRALASARDALVEQLGIDPGPELRRLERQILDQDPSLLATPARPVPSPAAPEERQRASPEVVGRAPEWAGMCAALAAAARGAAGLLLVEGEPGIGKTTLLDALVGHAARSGWRAARGRCAEPGLAPSLWPWIEVVRALVGGADTTLAADGVGEGGDPALAALLSHTTGGDPLSPVELAERVGALLRREARRGPLLVVLDDLHWADDPTLQLLTMVLERAPDVALLVAGGHRPAGLVYGAPLTSALGALTRLPHVTRIRLPGLGAQDVADLMSLVGGAAPSAEVAARVHERTAGNPLFVAELARLAGSGGVALDDVVPDAVRDVVRRRLAELPPVTSELLATAAVIGEDVELRVLAAASGHPIDDALDAVDAAIVTRVLVPGDAGTFRFAHALVRDAVLAELTPVRLGRLHRRVADAIESVHGADADHAEPIAWHRRAALGVDDPARVAAALVTAGDVARFRSAYERSEALLVDALDVARQVPVGPRRVSLEVEAMESLLSLETVRTFMGENLDRLVARMEDLATRNESAAMRQLVTFTRWSAINAVGPQSVERHADDALRAAQRAGDAYTIVIGEYIAGTQHLLSGRITEARPHFDRALAAEDAGLAEEPPLRPPLPMVPGMAAFAAQLAGDAAAADELLARQRAVLSTRRDAGVAVDWAFVAGTVLAMRGDAPGTAELTAFTTDPDRGAWMPHFSAACQVLHGWASIEMGAGASSLGVAAQALAELDAGPTSIGVPTYRTFFGAALLRLGDPACLHELRRARHDAEASGDRWWLAETLRLLASAEQAVGDPAATSDLLAGALALAARQGAALLEARITADVAAARSAMTP